MYCKSISFEGIDYTIIFVHIYVFNSSLDCLILSGSFFYVIIVKLKGEYRKFLLRIMLFRNKKNLRQ